MTERIEVAARELGFHHVKSIDVGGIVFDRGLRKSCELNTCRKFGTNYGCPPHIGTPEECIDIVKAYSRGVLVQYIGELEDSFDIEGMAASQDVHNDKMRRLRELLKGIDGCLLLGAGPCDYCETCTAETGEPCVSPENRTSSVEAHCIDVNRTLVAAGLKYNNGQNTVSYVGLVLCG